MHVILPTVLPIFIIALIGYGLASAGRTFDTRTISFLVTNIGTPALVFFNLSKTAAIHADLALLAGATFLAILTFLAVGGAALFALGLSTRSFLPSLTFPNTGNLGLPVALYAFGQEGLNYGIVIFTIVAICNFTIGQALAAGKSNWLGVLRSPLVAAAILGAACSAGDVHLPQWLTNMLSILAGLSIPLMLLMLGTSLAKISVTHLPRTGGLATLRMGMGLATGFAISTLLGFSGTQQAVFVLQCAMPVAVVNYLFAQVYETSPEDVASVIMISTLMSVATIPLLLTFFVA